jgi:hypothetical protein
VAVNYVKHERGNREIVVCDKCRARMERSTKHVQLGVAAPEGAVCEVCYRDRNGVLGNPPREFITSLVQPLIG